MTKEFKECPKCGYFMHPMYEYGKDSDAYVYICTKCFNVVGKSILDRLKEAIEEIGKTKYYEDWGGEAAEREQKRILSIIKKYIPEVKDG